MADLTDEVLHFHSSFDVPVWQYGTPTATAESTLTHVTAIEDRWVGRMMLPMAEKWLADFSVSHQLFWATPDIVRLCESVREMM